VVKAIAALTRRPDEPYAVYVERVANDPLARVVKRADLTDNLANNERTPHAPGNDERIRNYRAALLRLENTTNPSDGH
jgi:hypothetical protein